MAEVVLLTARRISPAKGNLTVPRIVQIPVAQIGRIIPNTKEGGSIIKLADGSRNGIQYRVFENQDQVNTAVDPNTTTNPYAREANLNLAAAGGNQGAAAALALYLNVVTSATATTQDGVRLPVAAGAKPFVVINATAININLYPATGGAINALATNAALVIAPGTRVHVVPISATGWRQATV